METHLRLYLVEWEDAVASDDQWYDLDGHKTNFVYTAGWLVEETVDTVTIACSVSDGGMCAGVMTIPRTSVRSMEELEVPKRSAEDQDHSPNQAKH